MKRLLSLDHPLTDKFCPSTIYDDPAIVAAEHIEGVMLGTEAHKNGGFNNKNLSKKRS